MKLKTKILSLLLCLILLFSAVPMASAGYTGVAAWFEPSLREMQQLGLLPSSFSDFDLSKDITRAEMCELAVHSFEKITGYAIIPEQTDYFSDTTAEYIVKAYELGIVSGYPDGTFKPNAKLTRQEFFQIIENFCKASAFQPVADESYLGSFADTGKVDQWAKEAAQICVRYGYVNGKAENSGTYLDPHGNASRQEAMAMFLRAYKSLNEYYYYIRTAEVVVEDNQGSGNVETGNNTVVEDVKITGVDKHMIVNASALNIRSLWSKETDIIGTVNYGTDLTVTGICENGWVQVEYKGKTGYVNGEYVDDYEEIDNTASDDAVDIANYAMQYVGYPYVYGAESPSDGFDCSGLVYYCFGKFGYSLKRTADDQMNNNGVAVSRNNLQVGDLVFFGNGSYANHVGIYIGNNNFVHAANPSSGVRVSSMNETYYANRYLTARRILTD
ncbi:MAG: C40 family peptidase [Oscillospiraceae bacterium]|nr:C40 family peptidase [Oscillospiraceae bacterium]